MAKEKEIDDLDRQILALLMENAKRPYTEIAQQLYVSGGTIHVRMNKMIEAGIVRGYGLEVDPEKLGFDVTAFLGIYLEKSSMYPSVAEALKSITEVTGAHYTTGLYNIFIKVVCRDTNHLRDVLHHLQDIDGIQRTETFISLEESINRPINVLDQAQEGEAVS